ncbi:MAG TPA: amidohydrolase family protein [Gemmatimonadaceae bacterium]|nr:amidohydrolase family protein [Gemmatimonadaceae bacterium]
MRRLRISSPSRIALAIALLAVASPARAQRGETAADSSGGPGYNLPLRPARPLRFTTDEGTWMSLDVSNDGQWIVFDLLGDIYKMPIAGGKATRLTSGQAFDGQPNFSPDGKTIVFVSDRSESDNLWLMDADGRHVRALTKETDHSYVSPTWTPDGKYVVASKSNSFSGGAFNVFMYFGGGGTGLQLTGTDSAAAGGRGGGGGRGGAAVLNNFVGPAFGPDGRYMYVAARNGGGGYNQTSLGWQIAVYDRETGRTFIRTDAPGSAMRPEVSPDGKWLVYATREDSVTSLRIRELSSGDEHWLVHRVQRDDQESRFTRDLEPPFAFTPDGKSIVAAYLGHFWRVSVPDGKATMIPFSADYDEMIGGAIKEQYPFDDSTITVHQIRDLAPSPDGRRMAFTALDRIWVMDLPDGAPHRLVASSTDGEYSPAWSPDGRSIAYVTWSDISGGDIYRMNADGSGAPQKLTTQSAFYENLTYAPDGRRLVFGRGPRDMRRDRDELERPNAQATGVELAWMPAAGGAATMIAPLTTFGQPHFGPDTSRIYVSQGSVLTSMRWDGTDVKDIIRLGGGGRGAGGGGGGASNILLSPDGSRVLVQSGVQAYVIDDVPVKGGDAPVVNTSSPAQSSVPVHKLTTVGGEFATWTADSKKIYFSLAHTLFTYDLAASATAIADSTERADSIAGARGAGGRDSAGGRGGRGGRGANGAANKPAYEAVQHDVVITVARDVPRGTVVLRGARIITMKGSEVIADGDIVVKDNRIVAVGPRGKVSIPPGARAIDVSGKTIIPGYVDIHAHIWPAFGVHRSQPFEYMVNLAYGVTTIRDPQTSSTDVLSYEDMVATGQFIGPRIHSTGPGVFAAENIKSLADAQLVLSRYSKYYQTNTIKQYMTGDRRVRQFVVMAAREQHLMPTLEGGLDFKKNLTEAMDGYSGSEHTLPIAPLYKDVIELYATAGITWTPTLIVEYGGPWAENYWYEHSDVLNDKKLNHFTPRDVVETKASRRPGWWAPTQWSFPLFAAQAAKVVAAGGRVGLGSHGQLQGLGAQWEIWNIASGGMPRMDVLRVATIFGAEAIGMEKDVGSIEAGKLADLQVLDRNPLDDIRNTNTIKYVMKNGRLYDGNTLDEIWPRQKAAPRLWWWTPTDQ